MERPQRVLWPTATLIGRLLVPSNIPPPDLDDNAVLFIKRHDVVVGQGCPSSDAGVADGRPGDAGGDGGIDAPADSGVGDAGAGDAGLGDAGLGDAGGPDGGECTTIWGDAVTMMVRPHVRTNLDGVRFAVLYVTPQRPVLETKDDVFDQLAQLTAPLIQTKTVEVEDPALGNVCRPDGCGVEPSGVGCTGTYDNTSWSPPGVGDAGLGDGAVVVEMAGPYQVVRAQPTDAAELARWLDQLRYAYTQEDLDAVAPYIALGWHVVAVRIAIDKPTDANLVPIALTWPGSEVRVTAALGRATGAAPWPLTVYIAAEGRYQLPGANVPFAKWTSLGGMGFLTKNQAIIDPMKPPSADPIAAHVLDGEYHETKIETEYTHVPVEVDCDDDGGCCRNCNSRPRARVDWGVIALAVLLVLRRRRR